jgi:hypothetical protein
VRRRAFLSSILLTGCGSVGKKFYLRNVNSGNNYPSAPVITNITSPTYTQVILTWTATALTTYYTIRRTQDNSPPIVVANNLTSNLSSISFTDNTVIASTTYSYKVAAVNSFGEGPQSTAATITIAASTVPAPNLTATLISSTQINLNASYVGPPAAAFYDYFLSTSPTGPWTQQVHTAGTAVGYTSLSPATTYYFKVYVTTVEVPSRQSPDSIVISGTTSGAPTGTMVKWHPGWYMGSNEVTKPGNAQLANKIIEQTAVHNTTNCLGWKGNYTWKTLETSLGVYDFSSILTDLAALKAYSPSLRLMIAIWAEDFSHTNPASNAIPDYILNDVAYGAGYPAVPPATQLRGFWQLGTYGCTAAVWRPAVMNRIKALYAALGAATTTGGFTFDTDPNVECVNFQETTLDLTAGSDFNVTTYLSQWQSLTDSMVGSFPHTNVTIEVNYMGPGDTRSATESLVNYLNTARAAFGGPDILGASSPALPDYIWGQAAYQGKHWNPSTSAWVAGGTDSRGKIPCIHAIQQPEMDGSQFGGQGAPFTMADFYQEANNILQVNHCVVTYIAGSGTNNWNGVVKPFMNSNIMTNTSCPISYGGFCNIA